MGYNWDKIKKGLNDIVQSLNFSYYLVLVLRNDFFFVVRSAVLANSVWHHKLSTFAAFY